MQNPTQKLTWLVTLAGVMFALLSFILVLSVQFDVSLPPESTVALTDRPILAVVALFVATFVVYLLSILIAKSLDDSKSLTYTIVGFAIVFRGLMFFSTPIQEVDIYRYIWDGVVVSEGISPFRYSPDQVKFTLPENTSDSQLKRLTRRYRAGSGDADALNLVHYGNVATVYPPVSQAVFGLSAICSSNDASLLTRLRVMKAWLVLFDIGTVLLLVSLLRLLKMPVGWAVAYAWCPLAFKEIANSGHLDSIAIFLTTAAVWLFVRNIMVPSEHDAQSDGAEAKPKPERSTPIPLSLTARWLPVVFLALAIGAKLYAIVLAPLFCFVALKKIGWKATVTPVLVFLVTTTIVIWPLLPSGLTSGRNDEDQEGNDQVAQQADDPGSGVEIFLKYWEMNDFIFMNTVENLKTKLTPTGIENRFLMRERSYYEFNAVNFGYGSPMDRDNYPGLVFTQLPDAAQLSLSGIPLSVGTQVMVADIDDGLLAFTPSADMSKDASNLVGYQLLKARKDPWFSIAPEQTREDLADYVHERFKTEIAITPFLTARFLISLLYFAVAIGIAFWAVRRNNGADFCRAAFLTIAWFWLLSPTQNPWYWLWAMPLIPFAKNRTWYLMSGILFVYYIRFWFEYHFTGHSVLASLPMDVPQWAEHFTKYQGVDFFDFVVTWLEYAPWFLLLIIETMSVMFWPSKTDIDPK